MNRFTLTSTEGNVRRGVLETPHARLETPFFMPIATKGAVKTLSSFDIERLGSPILLSNTYHLWLRPGLDVLKKFKGLHAFMDWDKALLTDSGGFQVFSLSGLRKLSEEGVEFQSHIDGAKLMLTPELCMEIQRTIGSDICMVLDVCTELPSTDESLHEALELTARWAKRSKEAFEKTKEGSVNPDAQLFGIIQGGTNIELRKKSAEQLLEIGFDGYAVGGLSVGEPFEEACKVLDALQETLPKDKPRYFMGGAQPHEIVAYVQRGIDMFDCVLPTRNARHGTIYRFVHEDLSKPDFFETIHVTNERFKESQEPIIQNADLNRELDQELSRYSMGYLRHLFTVNEVLGMRLATLVNLRFYLELMERIRTAIENDRL
ncbi:tRNA guanosine(34) transglycosylase Tgt [Candidatus Uhrbacteria bacterium CG22_combo_CG10-13_8_21_14_all_47_17]|uniref:Queuine tRNA-ribosyltransferase n=1 Tax=Candidatus Uhrbacteria bacterium CG22_combo_CG10-13_8_21_14_all_47_17 TaxID=1975041 RepID=A0A2H0BU08_9BACT|nr:MAG: tRNA guanosine(34) transglycosylase Tgt [Candidatus Uhrbacteria bacterium CG22_combo_CG10-13_8_21_14_all_47_17]